MSPDYRPPTTDYRLQITDYKVSNVYHRYSDGFEITARGSSPIFL